MFLSLIMTYNNTLSPVDCSTLKLLSNYCLTIFVLSILFNFIICLIFCYRKRYLKPANHFRLAFTVFNLVGALFELPIMVMSNKKCRYRIFLIFNYFFVTKFYNSVERFFPVCAGSLMVGAIYGIAERSH